MNDKVSTRTCPRWMKILLAVSLTMNFIVVGAAGAMTLGKHGHGHASHGLSRLVKAVPEDKRPAAQERIARDEARLQELGKLRRDLRETLKEIVWGENFSTEEFSAALETDRVLADEQRAILQSQVVDLFDVMEPEARKKAARRLARRLKSVWYMRHH